MTNRTFIKNDSEYPWEFEQGEEGLDGVIRWRTLLSGEKTPSKGISMGTLEIPPGAALEAHHHAQLEVYYLTAGKGRLRFGNNTRQVAAGDVVYIPPNETHAITNTGDSLLSLVWVFPTDTWSEIKYHEDSELIEKETTNLHS